MAEYLKTNLALLRDRKVLVPKIQGAADLDIIRGVGELAVGAVIGGRDVVMHSRHDPRKEASRSVGTLRLEGCRLILVFGCGMGYHLAEAAACAGERTQILLIERDPSILKNCLRHTDATSWLSRTEILLDASVDDVAARLDRLDDQIITDLQVLERASLVPGDPDYYAEVRRVTVEVLQRKKASLATTAYFSRLWHRNIVSNLQRTRTVLTTARMEGAFKLPFVIVAGGPSLDGQLEELAVAADRTVLIATATSVSTLLHAGVVPHFVISCDAGYANAFHLRGLDTSGLRLLTTFSVAPAVLRDWQGEAYLFSHQLPPENLLAEGIGEPLAVPMAGTVAATAYHLAKRFGATSLILAGLDLSYPGWMTHPRAGAFEGVWRHRARRVSPVESRVMGHIRRSPLRQTEAVGGGKVYASESLSLYRQWFEQAVRDSSIPVVNTSPSGAKVAGMADMPLGDALKKYGCSGINVDALIDAAKRPAIQHDSLIRVAAGLTSSFASLRDRANEMLEKGGLDAAPMFFERLRSHEVFNLFSMNCYTPLLKLRKAVRTGSADPWPEFLRSAVIELETLHNWYSRFS